MEEDLLCVDTKSQMAMLCNFEMMKQRIGDSIRTIGIVLSAEGTNAVIQTVDGGKVSCILGQDEGLVTSQVVEISAVQYGQIYRWDDLPDLSHLNSTIKLLNNPRVAKYLVIAAKQTTES
ncbi:kinase family protein, putative [Babesia ovis]|uniref:Kinase family protein, putative n=1 Tax=Babesia ovis TaxID=5869 RepID=A0A9W5TD28_BABOV|nr:kinase family protein, putative [Babesia ovis]